MAEQQAQSPAQAGPSPAQAPQVQQQAQSGQQAAGQSPAQSDSGGGSLEENFRAAAAAAEAAASPDKPAAAPQAEDPALPTPKPGAFASLHRREQALAQKQMELAKQRDEVATRANEWEQLKANGKRNPFAALKAIGYEDPTEFMKQIAETGGKWTPEQQELYELKQKLGERERREAELTKQQEQDRAAREYQQKVDNWHGEIANYAKSSEQWKDSLCALPGAEQMAFQVIADHYQNTQQVMPYDTALAQVDKHLQAQLVQTLEGVAATSQGRALLEKLAEKLGVVKAPASRSKSTPAHKQGLSGPIQQTVSGPRASRDDESIDERLAAASAWLSEISAQQG